MPYSQLEPIFALVENNIMWGTVTLTALHNLNVFDLRMFAWMGWPVSLRPRSFSVVHIVSVVVLATSTSSSVPTAAKVPTATSIVIVVVVHRIHEKVGGHVFVLVASQKRLGGVGPIKAHLSKTVDGGHFFGCEFQDLRSTASTSHGTTATTHHPIVHITTTTHPTHGLGHELLQLFRWHTPNDLCRLSQLFR